MISPTPTSNKRTLARPRPSIKTVVSQPQSSPAPLPIGSPLLSPTSMLARKASFQQLTQNSLASVPDGSANYGLTSPTRRGTNDEIFPGGPTNRGSGADIEVGDLVNTPGGMWGTVKFIGTVRGKAGTFVGVELEGELSGKGKNDGAVEGVRYFTTSTPLSGIFVPLNRASKRNSAASSNPPPTPTLTGFSGLTPPSFPTPSRRPESPAGRAFGSSTIGRTPARPSLSRPESPVRRQPPSGRPSLLPPNTPRSLSSATGNRLLAPSPTPGKLFGGPGLRSRGSSISMASGNNSRPGTSAGHPSRVTQSKNNNLDVKRPVPGALRSGSAMERRLPIDDSMLSSPADSGASGIGFARGGDSDSESAFIELQRKLAERERQLEEQAGSLLEMESTLTELQSLVANAQHMNSPTMRTLAFEDQDASQLRALLREKNEKIQLLTAEFDSHRADFRSTIDTLELASTETVRVYEKRVDDLLAELRELQERSEDVESVARQLKQLEELVMELEEGLEDARRGEAEARGEVEFLRGEVERSREELRREREKSAAAVANAAVGNMMRGGGNTEELEKKDEEIRGLKAIIHSLSRDTISDDDQGGFARSGDASGSTNGHQTSLERSISLPNGKDKRPGRVMASDVSEELEREKATREKLERDVTELEQEILRRTTREKELERELEQMKENYRASMAEMRSSVASERPSLVSNYSTSALPTSSSVGPPPSTNVPLIPLRLARSASIMPNTRPSRSTSTVSVNTDVGSTRRESVRDSRGTVASWRSAKTTTGPTQSSGSQIDNLISSVSGNSGLPPTTEDDDDDAFSDSHEYSTYQASQPVKQEEPKQEEQPSKDDSAEVASQMNNEDTDNENDGNALWCEICETAGHDILTCTNMFGSTGGGPAIDGAGVVSSPSTTASPVGPNPLTRTNTSTSEKKKSFHLPPPPPLVDGSSILKDMGTPVAGKESGVVDETKWCALCERDGHDSVDCPFDELAF